MLAFCSVMIVSMILLTSVLLSCELLHRLLPRHLQKTVEYLNCYYTICRVIQE